MTNRTRARATAATILAGALTLALTSCTPGSVPASWDQNTATITVGEASQDLQLWLQFGSATTATFLRANSTQLTNWQDSGTLRIVYHPLAVPDSTPAEQAYSRVAGSALAAIAENQPDKIINAMVTLGDTVVSDGRAPTEDTVQADLKAAGITVNIPNAVKKYGDAIQTATTKNRQTGPIRTQPSAILNGTFLNTGHTFTTDVTTTLNQTTPTPDNR